MTDEADAHGLFVPDISVIPSVFSTPSGDGTMSGSNHFNTVNTAEG